MNTNFWGPPAWKFLHTITFNYPEKIDEYNENHAELKFYYKQLFENFQFTLPCIYCRNSYKQFLKQDPIVNHLGSRKELTFWFYRIHNAVNLKLRKQERDLYDARIKALKAKPMLPPGELFRKSRQIAMEVFFTPPDPTYGQVCQYYEAQRASCSADANKVASCRL
jgi:hypothetical protein